MDITIQWGINNLVWKQIKKSIELSCQHCSYDSSSGILTLIASSVEHIVEHIDLKIIIEDDVLKDCHLEDSLFEI